VVEPGLKELGLPITLLDTEGKPLAEQRRLTRR